jgi:hypothetical protein
MCLDWNNNVDISVFLQFSLGRVLFGMDVGETLLDNSPQLFSTLNEPFL